MRAPALVIALSLVSVACAADATGAADRPGGGVGPGVGTTVPATGALDPPSTSTAPDPVAITLDSSNTGVVGGVRAGACAGDPSDPYRGLEAIDAVVVIDEVYIDEVLGGRRVLENFDVDGSIIVDTDDFTIRCGRVSGNEPYSIESHRTGLTIEWTEASQDDNGKVILGGGYDAYRCDVYGGEDGLHVNADAATITECYIHDQNHIGDDP
ncbi:MAG: hypothetical protein ACE5GB_08205, partial [Acidimicrobiales bacterium]